VIWDFLHFSFTMAELRPGAALAASLQQTVQDLEEQLTSRKAATASGYASATTKPAFAPELRRLEQQIEMERRQVERRLDKMERRIEEVASSSSSKGKWAELQGHVDGLEESLQNLIRGRNLENGQMITTPELPSLPVQQRLVDELEDQMLQISHRLLRLERGEGGAGGREESLAAPQDVVLKEMEQAMGQMSNFKGDWEEQMAVLEDQVNDLSQRLGELSQDVQELVVTREAQEEMEKLGQRTWQLTQKATSGQVETELRQEMGHLSEDLTTLFFRVEESEVGLYSLADAMNSICEELGRLKSSTAAVSAKSPAVTQPQTPKGGFHGASVAIDPPS